MSTKVSGSGANGVTERSGPGANSGSEPLLEITDLDVVYRQRRRLPAFHALRAATLSVQAGQIVGIVGESGSGKSTLCKAVLGLEPAGAGSIRYAGQDITHADRRTRRLLGQQIQAVFQDPYASFNPSRTIAQSVAESLGPGARVGRAQLRERVGAMLGRVGIDPSAMDRYPRQFSGGQRQRIAIARALLPGPRLVICDEPVSALDLSVQAQVLNLLTDLRRDLGVAIVFVSHDLGVVDYLCDRVVVLRRGEIVESGDVDQVCRPPEHPYTRLLLAAAPIADPARQAERRAERRRQASALS